MTIAYSYIRFSTTGQAKGDSLNRQTKLSEDYAREHSLTLDTTLNMKDAGVSAADSSNVIDGALGGFLKLARDGKIAPGSFLLVENLDRLSRAQIVDAIEVFMGIIRAEITIVTLLDKTIYSRELINANPQSLLLAQGTLIRAAEESATKSARIRKSWDSKRENINNKKLTSRCPSWMRISQDKKSFDLIQERVDVIKRIFKMAKDGYGNSAIIRRLNSEAVPPFSDKASGWYDSYIQKMFKSKAIYGEFQPCLQRNKTIEQFEDPIPNYYPAIFSREEWLLINDLRRERTKRGGVKKGKQLSNLFSGLLKCGYCGGTMAMGAQTSKKEKTGKRRALRYVACSTARRGILKDGKKCVYKQWNYADLEEQLLKFCKSVDFSTILGNNDEKNIRLENERKALLRIGAEIDDANRKIARLIADKEMENVKTKAIPRRIKELEDRIEVLENEKLTSETKVARISEDIKSTTNHYGTINALIEQLGSLESDNLYDLRRKLSSLVGQHIEEIQLFPLGNFKTEEELTKVEQFLKKSRAPKKEIVQIIKAMSREPSVENREVLIMFANGDSVVCIKESVMRNGKMYQTVSDFLEDDLDDSEPLPADWWKEQS